MTKITAQNRHTGKDEDVSNDQTMTDFAKMLYVPDSIVIFDAKSFVEKQGLTVCDAIKSAHKDGKRVFCVACGGSDGVLDFYADDSVRGTKEYKKICADLLNGGVAVCELPFPDGV